MEERLEPFVRHGTQEEPIEIKARDVMEAIAEKQDISIEYAYIEGDLDISSIEDRLESDELGRPIIEANIAVSHSQIEGLTWFDRTAFYGDVTFLQAIFSAGAHFCGSIFAAKSQFALATFVLEDYIHETDTGGEFAAATFNDVADFRDTTFNYLAFFKGTIFKSTANFDGATFSGSVNFHGAKFHRLAVFSGANFQIYEIEPGRVWQTDFSDATFSADVDFSGVCTARPADFSGVKFHENTICAGLKNDILSMVVKWLTRGKKELQPRPVTDFSKFNTNIMMNAASNPYLKRYIDDEQWIKSWRERGGKSKEALFIIWEATSHCGRSIGLWAIWSLGFILLFSFIFTPSPHWWPDWWWGFWRQYGVGTAFEQTAQAFDNQNMNFLDGFYLSIVSFTTLGFGDIIPANRLTRALLGLEVVLGYVMLGGLISIFANKFARRS